LWLCFCSFLLLFILCVLACEIQSEDQEIRLFQKNRIIEFNSMVGIFSRFSVVRGSHRRTQSAIDGREVLSPRSDLAPATNTTTTETHGIEVATEFKPVDHPMEPLDNDQPIQCPLPEPSILNVRFLKKFQEKKKLVFFDSENCKDRSVCRKLHSIFYDHRTGDSGKRECRLLR